MSAIESIRGWDKPEARFNVYVRKLGETMAETKLNKWDRVEHEVKAGQAQGTYNEMQLMGWDVKIVKCR